MSLGVWLMHPDPAPTSGAPLSPDSLSNGDTHMSKDKLLGVQSELRLSTYHLIWNFVEP